jgi:hypothetical protein
LGSKRSDWRDPSLQATNWDRNDPTGRLVQLITCEQLTEKSRENLRPGRTGQVSALAAAVAPAQHFQSAIVPDRQQSLGVGEHELHVAFAAAVAATP